MKIIIDFCKKKYKILIPLMVILVLLVAVYFFYKEYKYDNYRNVKEVAVFQHFNGIKVDYTALVTYNLKNIIVAIDAKNKKIEYNSVPIYYSKQDTVIFPSEMSIVFPLNGGSQYKLYKYSVYSKDGNKNIIKTANDTDEYYQFFLYDGDGLYFFPNEVTLNIDGKEYAKLSDMSYVQVVGGYTLTYYDKASDTSEFLEIEGKEITVTSENINVNLSIGYCMSLSSKVLLIGPDYLNAVK